MQNNIFNSVFSVLIFLLDVGTILGCLNQLACGLMVYGIAVRSGRCIIPWIVISGITYMLIVTTIFMAYLDSVPGVYVSLNELSKLIAMFYIIP